MRFPVCALLGAFAFSPSQPVIQYTLRVDPADFSAFTVEMRIRNARDTIRLAMNAHPEYDDKYWRYVENIRVESPGSGARVTRVDSAVWRVVAKGGTSVVRYTIRFPVPAESPRAAWRPFLSPTGGLVGGPHSFMYIVGHNAASSHVTLDIPREWRVATELTPTSDPRTYFAASVDALVEGPIFAGNFSEWTFPVDGVPHRVVYWRAPGATPFDTVAFVRGVRGVVEQSVAMFGRPPWREYTFVFQDAAYGGLEHPASVTLGTPSADLARDPNAYLRETAHEFFHAWNLMRIRPIEYRTVDYKVQPPTAGLWFSEGLTIFYSDLLMRRAGVTLSDSTRVVHLQNIFSRYVANTGNSRFSAERVSRAAYNSEPDALGDYSVSTHLQGEVIGAVLDFIIRDATDGRRTIDDVMRLMHTRSATGPGFTGADIERAVEDVCTCDVTPFFDAHVRGASAIDFDRYLRPFGYRTVIQEVAATDRNGAPAVDLGVWAYFLARDRTLRVRISNPESIWGRAGLHTGDVLETVNDTRVASWPELRAILTRVKIGDTLTFAVIRSGTRTRIPVVAGRLVQREVRIEALPNPSPRSIRLADAWRQGK